MRFNLVVNMERMSPDTDMRDVARHVTEMVEMADEAGFDIAWAAEHHAIEMTIAPGPFQLLAHLAAHTSRIRLGTAVVVAPYWHPIRLAGEAALCDLLPGGRLEFGIARGAYQYEFDAGDMIQCLPRGAHGDNGAMITAHGVECDSFLFHSGRFRNKYGRYAPPVFSSRSKRFYSSSSSTTLSAITLRPL